MKAKEVIEIPPHEAFQGMVRTFNLAIGAKADHELRVKLIQEEAEEFIEAVRQTDVVEAIDALCDLLYVVYGAADVFSMYLETRRSSETVARKGGPLWVDLMRELPDFDAEVSDVVSAIRKLSTPVDGLRDRARYLMEELANGCWECGAEALGVDLRPFFREVHRTNMHKLTGPIREDGKQLKPADWKPPRISAMYHRTQVGNLPVCDVVSPSQASTLHPFKTENFLPHPEGGHFCAVCGGMFVEEKHHGE